MFPCEPLSADFELTVLSREWCDLLDALRPLQQEIGFAVKVVDVDAFPELEAVWNEKVPVVLAGEIELCHYFLDEAAVRAHFLRIG